jgi:uncharacterized membrane protein HdeD (DUF308 family)
MKNYLFNGTCAVTSRSLPDGWFWAVLLGLIFVMAGSLSF